MEGEAEGEWVVSSRKKNKKQKNDAANQEVKPEVDPQRGKFKNKKPVSSNRTDQGPRNFDKETSSSTRSSSTSSSARAPPSSHYHTSKQNSGQHRKPSGFQDGSIRKDSRPAPSSAKAPPRAQNKPPSGAAVPTPTPLESTNVTKTSLPSGTLSYSAAASGSASVVQTQVPVWPSPAVPIASAPADSSRKASSSSKPSNAHSSSKKSETADVSQKPDTAPSETLSEQKSTSDPVSTPSSQAPSVTKAPLTENSKPSWSSIAGGKTPAPKLHQEPKVIATPVDKPDKTTSYASRLVTPKPTSVEAKPEILEPLPKSETTEDASIKTSETIVTKSEVIAEEESQAKVTIDESFCNSNGSVSLSDSEVSDVINHKDSAEESDEVVDSVDKQAFRVDLNKNEVTKNGEMPITLTDLNDSTSSSKSGSQVNLKYNYKEDQWSPINMEGKRQYDRQFLLQLRDDPRSQEKPSNLPPMEIIKDRTSAINFSQNNKDWLPGFVKGVPQKPSLTKRASRDGSKRSSANPSKVIDLQIKEVELVKSENPWKPAKLQETQNSEAEDEVKSLLRRARGILNKLCPQKFDDLVGQFKELNIDTGEKLEACIELIFEKAVDEPGFSVAYARMCDSLRDKNVMAVVPEGEHPRPVEFRTILVNRCQVEFEKDYMAGLDRAKYEADLAAAEGNKALKSEIEEDWMEKERRARRKSLGNVQFIGELYKLNMLSDKTMHSCIRKLIQSREEESLESLCRLLSTIGKTLDEETTKKNELKPEGETKKDGSNPFTFYFNEIERLSQDESLCSRIRFMLQDVLDLRKDGWKPRRDVAGPKTREQIKKEVEREKTEQQLKDDLMPPRNRERDISGGNSNSRDARKRAGRHSMQAQISEDGWTSVHATSRSSQKYEVDANKIASFAQMSAKRFDSDDLQLGPGTRSTWGQGSNSQRRSLAGFDSQVNTRNKFSMLNIGETDNSRNDDWQDHKYSAGGSSKSMILHSRNSRGPGSDKEKQMAVEAVRQAMNGPRDHIDQLVTGPNASIGPPTTFKRPVPENIPEAFEVVQHIQLLYGNPNIEDSEVRKQANLIVDDYLTTGDLKDAVDNVCRWLHPTTIELFVQIIIDKSLEKLKDEEIFKVGIMFSTLIDKNILLKKQLQDVLNTFLESADDLSMDIPKLWTYIGEILAPGLHAKVLPMSFLSGHILEKDGNLASKFLAGAISSLLQISKIEEVCELWKSSGLHLNEFIDENEIDEFIKSNKFEFLTEDEAEVLTPEKVSKKLSSLLKNNDDNDVIITWIEQNVEDPRAVWFVRVAAATVVDATTLRSSEGFVSDKDSFKHRSSILRRYIDGKINLEVQALYAVHHLMHKLEHPRQLLQSTFENLFDEEIISEEAFFEWEASDDPAEMEGKGVAINETKGFFKWLRDASEEDDENVKTDDTNAS